MVFESLVVDLINRYLGDYVEKLDTSQLQIGLLGGNAKLENLDIKANAFDDLDLPIKVLQGHIGKLTLKIPFKHLYSEPVVAELDGLYVLVVPNAAVSYNDEKEKRYLLEAKQKELRQIEEAKQREAEKSKGQKEEVKKDTFTEKLLAQIVKNVQIDIRNIHIRYEDNFTNPDRPFCMGITLNGLSFQTCDSSGSPITIKEDTIREFYKFVRLDSLAVYWNSKQRNYSDLSRGPLKNMMRSTIASPGNVRQDFNYVIRPISSSAMMHIHMSPDQTNFTVPQLSLDLNFQEIDLAITRGQYSDITRFLEAMDRMWTQSKFLKYRPAVPLRGNWRTWWHYPYDVILEETVRRRRRMWSWEHIKHHRTLCRRYTGVWCRKILGQKLSAEDNRTIELCESELDLLNLVLCRQQGENQAKKTQRQQKKSGSKGGWFGWFGGQSSASGSGTSRGGQAPLSAAELQEKLYNEITADEKAKLYRAIDYSEQVGTGVDLPKTYVSTVVKATLQRFAFTMIDEQLADPRILKVAVNTLCTDIVQRSSAEAIKVSATVSSMQVIGCKQSNDEVSTLITSQPLANTPVASRPLLTVLFETHPMDTDADQKVIVHADPLEIVYNAETVNKIVRFLTPPEEIRLSELSSTVLASLEDVKEMTATGLKYLASQRLYTDIQVDVRPSYFILPEKGVYKEKCRFLLVDLGSVQIVSQRTQDQQVPAISSGTEGSVSAGQKPSDPAVTGGSKQQLLKFDEVKESAYDRFKMTLSSMQILMISEGDDWRQLREEKDSNNHILRPLSLNVNIKKCIVANDINLPNLMLDGCLPVLFLDLSDHMLKSVLELVLHIPFPEPDKKLSAPTLPEDILKGVETVGRAAAEPITTRALMRAANVYRSNSLTSISSASVADDDEGDDEFFDAEQQQQQTPKARNQRRRKKDVNLVDINVVFLIQNIEVLVSERKSLNDKGKAIFNLLINDVGATFIKRRWDQELQAYLGSIALQVPQFSSRPSPLRSSTSERRPSPVCLVRTKQQAPQDQTLDTAASDGLAASDSRHSLLYIKLIMVEKSAPEFTTTYMNTRHHLVCEFKSVELCLHQEALVLLMGFANSLIPALVPPGETKDTTDQTWSNQVGDQEQAQLEAAKAASRAEVNQKLLPTRTTVFDTVDNIQTRKMERRQIRLDYAEDASSKASDDHGSSQLGEMVAIPEISIIQWRVQATVEKIKVTICSVKEEILRVSMRGMRADVDVTYRTTQVSMILAQLRVHDAADVALYKKLVWIEPGESIFTMQLVLFNQGTDLPNNRLDPKKLDVVVCVEVGKLYAIFLYNFIHRMLTFLENFQVATEKVAQQAQELSQAAVQQVQQAVTAPAATRVSLEINMQAPVIYVPQNSRSTNALMLDLGFLQLTNSFQLLDKPQAMIEVSEIKLENLRVARIIIMEHAVKSEKGILKPINVSLTMKRNLWADQCNDLPNIDISGSMKAVHVMVSQSDYLLIQEVLLQNFAEVPPPSIPTGAAGPRPSVIPPSVHSSSDTPESRVETKDSKQETLTSSVARDDKGTPIDTTTANQGKTALKFSFVLGKIKLDLFKGDIPTEEWSQPISPTDPRNLGQFVLEKFSCAGHMKLDNSVMCSVDLTDLLLVDTRPGSANRITKMLQSKTTKSDTPNNVVSLSFEQDKSGNKILKMHVKSIYVCMCMEYMMAVSGFFINGQPAPVSETAMVAPKGSDTNKRRVRKKPVQPAIEPRVSELELHAILDEPQIILVESMDSMDTNALVMTMKVMFDYHMKLEMDLMNVQARDFQVIACPFDEAQRSEYSMQIVSPCEVSVYTNTPLGQGMHGSISMGAVLVTITPATIETLSKICATLTLPNEEETKDLKGPTDQTVPDDLWDVKAFNAMDLPCIAKSNLSSTSQQDEEDIESGFDVAKMMEEITERRQEQGLNAGIHLRVQEIRVVLESELGNKCVPMLILESCVDGDIKNPSSNLSIGITVEVCLSYYNEHINEWELLLETFPDEGNRRWSFQFEMITADDTVVIDHEDWDDLSSLQPTKSSILLLSRDNVEFTLSKTALDVLGKLAKSFEEAYKLRRMGHGHAAVAPYNLLNLYGCPVTARMDERLMLQSSSDDGQPLVLQLEDKQEIHLTDRGKSVQQYQALTDSSQSVHKLGISVSGSAEQTLRIGPSEKRVFTVGTTTPSAEAAAAPVKRQDMSRSASSASVTDSAMTRTQILVQTTAYLGMKTVILKSIVQLSNLSPLSLSIYFKPSTAADDFKHLTDMKPNDVYDVPCYAVYAQPGGFHVKPAEEEAEISATGVSWAVRGSGLLECTTKRDFSYYFSAAVQAEEVFEGTQTEEKTARCYAITFKTAVSLHNQLPIPLTYRVPSSSEAIEPGSHSSLLTVAAGQAKVKLDFEYMGKEWTGNIELSSSTKADELGLITFESREGYEVVTMDIGLRLLHQNGHVSATVFSPYWMVNKTGQILTYKAGDDYEVTHPPEHQGAVLFSFRSKSIFGKKKAMIRVHDSSWSDKFSLDTVASSGRINCKTKSNFSYEIGVKISLSSSGLSKIVTFLPYFMIINKSQLTLLCNELSEGAGWLSVSPNEAVPFWPLQTASKNMLMRVKVEDSEHLVTQPFPFYESHSVLVKLEKKYGGIFVEVQTTEEATLITLQQYNPGLSVALLVNHLGDNKTVLYRQSGLTKNNTLPSGHSVLYAWEDARLKREIIWSCEEGKKTYTNTLNTDGIEDFYVDDAKAYWVSFMWDMQRVLLFTNDINVAKNARLSADLEPIDQEITISLQSIGLSLVDNEKRQELAYVSVTSSGVRWNQMKRKNRLKALKLSTSHAIEQAYESYANRERTGGNPPEVVVLDQLQPPVEVDLAHKIMLKPEKCDLVRTFEPGVYLQYKTSPNQMHLHVRIYRVQVDDQMADCTFPVVFSPYPTPKSVAADSGPKPLIELSSVIGKTSDPGSLRFKYFRVLIQEMQLKLDQGFLNAVIDFLASSMARAEEEDSFKLDQQLIKDKLIDTGVIVNILQGGKKSIFDNFHISPLKTHVSFSMTGSSNEGRKAAFHSEVLDLFLKSIGMALTDSQDLIFKLAYFERQNCIMTMQQMTAQIQSHYMNQGIKQAYVLLLGLDVLGNPFGVLRGVAQGVEDLFYEPVKGAVLGPEEFAEGVALGVKSLFGHALGGAAGAVSRITGTLGKGIAALTLDDDYQKRRREQLAKRPDTLGAGLARGGKGLVMGVFHGVTGIVTKPVEGAKKDGVEGFFKGVGKGLVGVVTRPVSGVVDFASSSFEGIRRVADTTQEVCRIRPPRFISKDGVIRPYMRREAEGNDILKNVDKGKYAATDLYDAHIYSKSGKQVLLLTNHRLFCIDRNELLGTWSCDWHFTFDKLSGSPTVTPKGLLVTLKEKQKRMLLSSQITKEFECDALAGKAMAERITRFIKSSP